MIEKDTLFISCLVVVVLSACQPSQFQRPTAQSAAKTADATPFTSSSGTPAPSSTLAPLPLDNPTLTIAATLLANKPNPYTPAPTMTTNEISRMAERLRSAACQLPCYLGIRPGETQWETAKSTLQEIGARYRGEWPGTEGALQEFDLTTGEVSLLLNTPLPETGIGQRAIRQDISLTVVNDRVVRVDVTVQPTRFVSIFQQYWSRYSTRAIFLSQGQPTEMAAHIGAGGGYSVGYAYADHGIVVEENGTVQAGKVCPGFEDTSIGLRLVLTDLSSGLGLFPRDSLPFANSSVWSPVPKILGITESEFYSAMIADQDSCFEIQGNNP